MPAFAELILFAVAAVAVVGIGKAVRKNSAGHNGAQKSTMRCPGCGSPVVIHGNTWECPYCGNSGRR